MIMTFCHTIEFVKNGIFALGDDGESQSRPLILVSISGEIYINFESLNGVIASMRWKLTWIYILTNLKLHKKALSR